MENWAIYNKTGDFEFIRQLCGVNSITARLLVNRGLTNEKDIMEYLYPDIGMLISPLLIKNMKKTCDILEEKIRTGMKIRVIGDYDVDGVISTYILTDTLIKLGAEVDYRIPERIRDGYGVNDAMINEAYSAGIDTILTCDNGIAAVGQAILCRQLGMTMLVTDHHDIPAILPDAESIIDVKQKEDDYPYKNICGAVVAAKLAEALYEQMKGTKPDRTEYLEYMAMATICDVIELTGESRIIAKLGMEKLGHTENMGLQELIRLCELNSSEISEYQIGYVIGPCFNATGRLDVADTALKLLYAKTKETAASLAAECKRLNDERKKMTKQQEEVAYEVITREKLDRDMVMVVYVPGCHESLTGIIAGRLREKYNKPAIVLTDGVDLIKGSARSIEKYNIFEELCKCDDLLEKYGGHPMAAGMSLKFDNVNKLRERLNNLCMLKEQDIIKKVLIDAEVSFCMFNELSVKELSLLEPFGAGNEKPVFAEKKLMVKRITYIGKTTKYLKFTLQGEHGNDFQALYFHDSQVLLNEMSSYFGEKEVNEAFAGRGSQIIIMATYYPKINEYMGYRSIQMNIQGIKFAG